MTVAELVRAQLDDAKAEGGVLLHCLAVAYDIADELPDNIPAPKVLVPSDGGVEFLWGNETWAMEIDIETDHTEVWVHNRETRAEWAGEYGLTKRLLFGQLREMKEGS